MNDETVVIGELEFGDNFSIYEITINPTPTISSLGKCRVEVRGMEGQIPHFHIVSIDGKDFCICIYEAKYFNHNPKTDNDLSSSQQKDLDEWLREPNCKNNKLSNWEFIVITWETMYPYPKCKFPESKKVKTQPNYKKMTKYRP